MGFIVYFALPDVSKLRTGAQLVRTHSSGKTFDFLAGPQNKKYVRYSQISKYLRTSVIMLEDARFFSHSGFDVDEIVNALDSFIKGRRRLRGASTITQQLAKNLYLSPERTFRRKIIEAFITLKLEYVLTKKEILEIYLNSIDFGRGFIGVTDASQFYFKKSASRLNLKEAIFLAAIIPNPTRFGRLGDNQLPKKFVRRQMMRALKDMYRMGDISFMEFESVMRSPYEFSEEGF